MQLLGLTPNSVATDSKDSGIADCIGVVLTHVGDHAVCTPQEAYTAMEGQVTIRLRFCPKDASRMQQQMDLPLFDGKVVISGSHKSTCADGGKSQPPVVES